MRGNAGVVCYSAWCPPLGLPGDRRRAVSRPGVPPHAPPLPLSDHAPFPALPALPHRVYQLDKEAAVRLVSIATSEPLTQCVLHIVRLALPHKSIDCSDSSYCTTVQNQVYCIYMYYIYMYYIYCTIYTCTIYTVLYIHVLYILYYIYMYYIYCTGIAIYKA